MINLEHCVACYLDKSAYKCKDRLPDVIGNEKCFWYNVVKKDLKTISDYNSGKVVPMCDDKPCTTFNLEEMIE